MALERWSCSIVLWHECRPWWVFDLGSTILRSFPTRDFSSFFRLFGESPPRRTRRLNSEGPTSEFWGQRSCHIWSPWPARRSRNGPSPTSGWPHIDWIWLHQYGRGDTYHYEEFVPSDFIVLDSLVLLVQVELLFLLFFDLISCQLEVVVGGRRRDHPLRFLLWEVLAVLFLGWVLRLFTGLILLHILKLCLHKEKRLNKANFVVGGITPKERTHLRLITVGNWINCCSWLDLCFQLFNYEPIFQRIFVIEK